MPVVHRAGPYTFFFYSNEGNPLEPPHIHVRGNGGEAKMFLEPPAVVKSDGLSAKQLHELLDIVEQYLDKFLGAYNEYFTQTHEGLVR